jgi:hypothetical protein
MYRIGRGSDEPFALPDWDRAEPDGTFGNRFDDSGGIHGIPADLRFRVIYCATQHEAAFAEVTSRFRQRPALSSILARIEDDEETVEGALGGAVDPNSPNIACWKVTGCVAGALGTHGSSHTVLLWTSVTRTVLHT